MKDFFKKAGSEIIAYLQITDKVILLMAAALSFLSCLLIYSLYP